MRWRNGTVGTRWMMTAFVMIAAMIALPLPGAEPVSVPADLATSLTNTVIEVSKRKAALLALIKTPAGADQVLQMADTDLFPVDLRMTATLEFTYNVPADLKQKAAAILPPYLTQNSVPLPPLATLLKMKGDAFNGAKVYMRPDANCINCHLTSGRGVEIGPDLSDAGLRLSREELFENILEPNATISPGFEAWQLTLKNGDDVYGILAGETAAEVTLKDHKGALSQYKLSDITKRQKLRVSIMPMLLQQVLTVQELVDLVEYMSTLKTPVKKKN